MDKKAIVICLIAAAVISLAAYQGISLAARDETVAPENVVAPHTVTEAEIGLAAVCPVCKANLTVAATTPALEYQGVVYYFDLADCATAFTNDPNTYINPPESP